MEGPDMVVIVTIDPATLADLEALLEAAKAVGAMDTAAGLEDLLACAASVIAQAWKRPEGWERQMLRLMFGF